MITYSKIDIPTEIKFSIIIPTWNNLPYLQQCLESLNKNSFYDHQVVLHINEGTDGTPEWARENGYSFSHSEENLGVCQACNAAYTLTEADYILFLNDDMYVLPDWDKALYNEIEKQKDNKFYMSGTLVEPYASGNNCALAPYDFGDTIESFDEQGLLNKVKDLVKVKSNWNGATWPPSLMHRQIWDRIGGYSIEYMPGYYSDPDLSAKLWSIGVRRFIGVSSSLVYHFMSKSTNRHKKKPGYDTFIKKWGMTARFFTRNFLKIGSEYNGRLPNFDDKQKLKIEKLRSGVKILF